MLFSSLDLDKSQCLNAMRQVNVEGGPLPQVNVEGEPLSRQNPKPKSPGCDSAGIRAQRELEAEEWRSSDSWRGGHFGVERLSVQVEYKFSLVQV